MLLLTRREIPDSARADQLEHALRSRGRLVCELPLRRLPDDGAAALARQTARLTDEQVARVVRRAEGNPLFAVETARALAAGQEEVPPSLRIPVRAALAAVESDARRLTEVAAVAARRLDPAELRALDLTSADEAAGAALQTGLLVAEGGGVGFRHALLRDAAYEEIAPPRRPGVHERWARALLAAETAGAPARPAEVARHLRLAAADREAVPQLLRAAREARAVAALAAAIEYVEEALSIAPDRPDLWLELGELEAWRPRREAAERAFARALSLLDAAPPLDRARALLCQARAYHGPICYPRGVLDCASRALELLESSGSDAAAERSEALAAWAWAEAVAGSADRAEELLAELSVPGVAPDDSRVYDVGHARALALMRRGRFADAYAPSVAAGEAIARAGRPDLTYGCWANAASAAHAAGDNRRALEFIERGMAAVRGHGLQALEVHLLGARSHVLRETGRVEEGRAAADAALELAERLGAPELIAMASHDSGLAALATGEHERAARLLADALVDGAPISRPLTRLALAEALARGGRPEAATEQVRAAVLEPVRPSDFPETLVPRLARVQGLIEIASGNREEAVRRLEEARGGWRRLVERLLRSETITVVLADLGRPVVGLIDPEHELARVPADIDSIGAGEENLDALVP
jgi:tetratricopeptide (TPR) repeat protein